MRILIAYGSSRGGTAGLAEMVAKALIEHGLEADIDNAAEISDLTGYDGVIVGGALYNNHWHSDATDFVHRFASVLHELPLWFFSSGPLDDTARSGALAPVPQVRDLARKFDIRGHMTFGGVLEKRSAGKLGSLLSYGAVGDWRDPTQVAQWVDRIVTQLGQPRAAFALTDRVTVALTVTEPDRETEAADAASRLGRIRRLLSSEELDDDAGLDVLL